MRMAKRIITTLLALQLFFAVGLCGGACCAMAPEQANRGGSAVKDNYKPATEEKIESGHCPMHAGKKAMPEPHERRQLSSRTAQHSLAPLRQNRHQARSSSAVEAHFCACSIGRQQQPSEALTPRSPEQRPVIQILSAALNPFHWLIESSPPQNISPDSFHSHSPPYSGS